VSIRKPEADSFGETFFDASDLAIAMALFVNRPSGGRVESVLTFATQRFDSFVGTFPPIRRPTAFAPLFVRHVSTPPGLWSLRLFGRLGFDPPRFGFLRWSSPGGTVPRAMLLLCPPAVERLVLLETSCAMEWYRTTFDPFRNL
jgi:hypothetical protein